MNVSPSAIPNIRCLVAACQRLAIPYTYYDDNNNFVGINLSSPLYFANATTPFDNQSVSRICKDKEFTYRLLKGTIAMPETMGFLDPHCNDKYQKYVKYHSLEDITSKICATFALPVIVKKNAGAQGQNVFLCKSEADIYTALQTIYNKNSYLYDYVALAQQHIPFTREFRVVMFNQKIKLVYEKDISAATFTGNLSPLHQENSKAVVIEDEKTIERIDKFVQPLFAKLAVNFTGLDIVIDAEDKFWLIEINTRPGFEHFCKDNGDECLIEMYQQILLELSQKSDNV